VRLGFCSETAILNTLKSQLGLPSVDLETVRIDEKAIAMVKEELAKKHLAMPVEITGRTLVVAMSDPLNVSALEDLRFQSGLFVRPVLATPTAIQNAIARHYGIDQSISEVIKGIIGSDDDVVISSVKAEEKPDLGACWDRLKFGYDQDVRTVVGNLFSSPGRHIKIDYPFQDKAGALTLPIRLFSSRTLRREIEDAGFRVKKLAACPAPSERAGGNNTSGARQAAREMAPAAISTSRARKGVAASAASAAARKARLSMSAVAP